MSKGSRVEVRETRAGRLLLIDGSHASLWRPGVDHTGSIWDLLASTVCLVAAPRPRVLLCGLGGGSVLRLLRVLSPEARIDAVELSRDVVAAAREAFDLDDLGARVHVRDAARHLARVPRGSFDLVIDDVYTGAVGSMFKPEGWRGVLRHAYRAVAPEGALVVNVLTKREEGLVAGLSTRSALRLEHRAYHNRILVLRKGAELPARAVRPLLRAKAPLATVLRHTRISTVTRVP